MNLRDNYDLGQIRRSRSQVEVRGHRTKNVPFSATDTRDDVMHRWLFIELFFIKVVGAILTEGFLSINQSIIFRAATATTTDCEC